MAPPNDIDAVPLRNLALMETRLFDAPPLAVFDAWTRPQLLPTWWGQQTLSTAVCEVDLRVGGSFRIVQREPSGQEFGFHGTYREVRAPERLVFFVESEYIPEEKVEVALDFIASHGGTELHITIHDARDSAERAKAPAPPQNVLPALCSASVAMSAMRRALAAQH